jgi:hypothetical protein
MKTKLEMECELLMVEHDVTHNLNNERAFVFRSQFGDKAANLESAHYFEGRKQEAQRKAAELRAAIALA